MYQVVSFGVLPLMEIQWLNLAEMWMRGLGNLKHGSCNSSFCYESKAQAIPKAVMLRFKIAILKYALKCKKYNACGITL